MLGSAQALDESRVRKINRFSGIKAAGPSAVPSVQLLCNQLSRASRASPPLWPAENHGLATRNAGWRGIA